MLIVRGKVENLGHLQPFEAPVNIKSIDAEIRLDCPLKSSNKATNMAYKLEPVDSHEIDVEAIEYEGISEAVNSDQ